MQYINSLKMKLSVIFGVLQMVLGLCINITNKIRKRNWLTLITLSIPQLIFLLCTFIYMNFLILYKWFTNYHNTDLSKAPSIISTMISVYIGFSSS
jgi:V-type H+-transporting ATPase subunit a